MSSSKHLYTKILTLTFAIFASLLLASSTFTPNIASAYTRGNANFGIATGSLNSTSLSNAQAYFTDIAQTGFKWVRFDIAWKSVQPTDPGTYNWSMYDGLIATAAQSNLKVLGVLDKAPTWASSTTCSSANCAPASASQFATFAAAAATHYGTNVSAWEIWNEENTITFWGTSPNATSYAQILKASYKSIKAANPQAAVVTGGLSPCGSVSGQRVDSLTYFQQMYAAGAAGYFDAVAYHPYSYPSTLYNSSSWTTMTTMHLVMMMHSDGNKQIWITEYGAPTNGPSGSNYVSEAAQAQLVTSAYDAMQSQSMFGPFFWYAYKDRGTDTSTVQNFYGFVRSDGSEKPAYSTWQHLLQ